jgi:hypothetical protein
MTVRKFTIPAEAIPVFGRDFWSSEDILSRIGAGSIGGKASGLAFIQKTISGIAHAEPWRSRISVGIPHLVVIATDVFDQFMERNKLHRVVGRGLPDDQLAHAFLKSDLPAETVGDLRALITAVHTPLAIRSSSMLEDAMYQPFAGVYATKMIPNHNPDPDVRFQRLVESIKLVYASTFFREAIDYRKAAGKDPDSERMAVIIQEVVGAPHDTRFYPDFSGVARSYNYYAFAPATPEDGVVDLALGLGKTIVDGGVVWTYSPAKPKASPPVASPAELLDRTQTEFWAIHMGAPPPYDPTRETEYLVRASLADAEFDGTLRWLASTYRAQDDRIVSGTSAAGARLINFSPLLVAEELPLNTALISILRSCEEAAGGPVEVEFAVTLGRSDPPRARIGFLQVRPMVVLQNDTEIDLKSTPASEILVQSDRALGHAVSSVITDIVYVRPDGFEGKFTPLIATEIEQINRRLAEEQRPYLLIGFGRWGSSDPWLGIPVNWSQISGAKAIVEAALPQMNVDFSQGSHFFHNLSSFGISYLSVRMDTEAAIDWPWLDAQPIISETAHVRHVRVVEPLTLRVDGRRGKGVVFK